MIAGLPDIYIGDTICDDPETESLPAINIDEPTISLNFLVNNSPFAGKEGKLVTSRQIKERLERELEVNVGLKIDFSANDYFKVYGRGELHIVILLENMRREGYEIAGFAAAGNFQRKRRSEIGTVWRNYRWRANQYVRHSDWKIRQAQGLDENMHPEQNHTRIVFEIPTRGLLGYRGEFVIDTRGEGILCSEFIGFKPYAGEIEHKTVGSQISMATGKALGFSLYNLQDRGQL